MSSLGRVRIGHQAPDFKCDAVVKGLIQEVSLSTFISSSKPSWLILLFIPAAFSFVCPTEVLAFQNCLDEFKDRNCDVVFVSVDTKHSLWHWQNVPRQYGGLGQIDIALLSDANHKMSRDYGVLIEEEGVCLRGMFILDDKGIIQQVTLNNLTVGRSVLEALRLLEAFQAVAKHGVLCPIDWKPSTNTSETINTISNTLTESYDERLANLQKEFGDTPVTDLDAKHKVDEGKRRSSDKSPEASTSTGSSSKGSKPSPSVAHPPVARSSSPKDKPPSTTGLTDSRSNSNSKAAKQTAQELPSKELSPSPGLKNDCLPRASTSSSASKDSFHSTQSMSAPATSNVTPTPTPSTQAPAPLIKKHSYGGTARHSRGHHSTAPPNPSYLSKHNTYESRRGSHVILEFADPTSSPQASPNATPSSILPPYHLPPHPHHSHSHASTPSSTSSPTLSRSTSLSSYPVLRRPPSPAKESPGPVPSTPGGQTRLQATFEAIKKMSAGLSSPRIDFSPRKTGDKKDGEEKERGYFDVAVEGVET